MQCRIILLMVLETVSIIVISRLFFCYFKMCRKRRELNFSVKSTKNDKNIIQVKWNQIYVKKV